MKEVKNNKKPFIFYYTIVIVIMILLNMFVFPKVLSPTVKEVGYDTFLTMLDKKEIQQVQVEDNQIIFSDNADPVNYYKTGVFNDPDLVNRLQDAGVEFGTEIVEEASPWMSLLVSMVPFIIMIVIGQMLMKNLNKKMGGMMGGNAMTFGKSNAKIYVESTTGIKFSDVAGEDEAKEILTEIVDFLHNPAKYTEIGATMPNGRAACRPSGNR